jgi:hypothetical protein
MKRIFVSLLAVSALLAFAGDPATAAKKCKAGKVFDEATGKCVTKRGS